MIKKISLFLIPIYLFSLLCGCAGTTPIKKKSPPAETAVVTTSEATTATGSDIIPRPDETLHDKKVIFIGNSYTQNGMAVIWKNSKILEQEPRSNDQGMFYQLCSLNGMDVNVTNWCFGGHNMSDLFGGPCTVAGVCKGVDHASYLTDRNYDYVVLQCYQESNYTGDLLGYLSPVMDLFRAANPEVRFILLVPHMAYEKNHVYVKDVPTLQGSGITVCSWGGMLYDICNGTTQVPGAELEHTRSSYVVSVSENDGFHENMLAGYLTALMTFCGITGQSAVGQPYQFCNDDAIHPKFNFGLHRKQYYTYDPNTNFDAIFQSPMDMNGLQMLIDEYLERDNWS